jgi:hypothetical protein
MMSIGAVSSGVFGSVNYEYAHGIEDKVCAILDEDGESWETYCCINKDKCFTDYDLTTIESKLRNEVSDDPIAKMAMDIFLASDYRKFVDYCVGDLQAMTGLNQQKFKEILILLAPGICSSEYAKKIISIVGMDRNKVRAAGIQYLSFCLDMFFYAAVRNGQLGRYALANMLTDAFYAPCLNWDSNGCADSRFTVYDIEEATFGNWCCDDWLEISYDAKRIWPNWT